MKGTITEADRRFGRAVAAARKEFKMSQREAAAALGVTQTTMHNLERTRYAARLSIGARAACYFGIDLDEFFGGEA